MKNNEAGTIHRRSLKVGAFTVLATMIALSGCYIFPPSQASQEKLQTRLHFDVTQCQQIGTNLYKCPNVDKSICGPYYSGQQVDCVKLDQDGNVIVMKQ
ncbi:MAG: hypothetical protein WCA22_02865 [Candidatus Binatus sp.]